MQECLQNSRLWDIQILLMNDLHMRRLLSGIVFCGLVLSCGSASPETDGPLGPIGGNPDETIYKKADGALRLVAYNVGSFSKYTTDSSPMVAAMMKELEADVMVMNELDRNNDRHDYDQLAEFAEQMDWNCYFAKAMDYRNGEYGNGAAYRKDLKAVNRFVIALPKVTGSEDRSCVVVEFEDFVYAGTHLEVKTVADRITGVQTITSELKEKYYGKDKPVFLGGDMNSFPDSEVIAELKKDWKMLTPASPTFPSSAPVNCADYIFALNDTGTYKVTASGVCSKFSSGSVKVTSDHLPVYADVELE